MKNVFNVLIVPVFLLCSFQKENNLAQKKHSEKVTAKSDRIIYLFFKAGKDQSGNTKLLSRAQKLQKED
ncbi:hypothetical protein OWR28_04185 [Chryseobacterium sp. 1B4]